MSVEIYPDDDYMSGIGTTMARKIGLAVARRRRTHRNGMSRLVAWRSAGPRGMSGEDRSYALSTPKGTLSIGPEGLSFVKPAKVSAPPPSATSGPMDFIKRNPAILAGGAVALIVLLKILRKKRR